MFTKVDSIHSYILIIGRTRFIKYINFTPVIKEGHGMFVFGGTLPTMGNVSARMGVSEDTYAQTNIHIYLSHNYPSYEIFMKTTKDLPILGQGTVQITY